MQVSLEPPVERHGRQHVQIDVNAFDASGNPATNFGSQGETVTLKLGSNPGGATFTPVTVTASGGMAKFTGLTLNKAGTATSSPITSPGLTGVTTSLVNATAAGATQLAVTTQPLSTITAGTPFGFTVSAEDADGNPVTNFIGDVTVSLGNQPRARRRHAWDRRRSQPDGDAVNGVANFSGLTLNKAFSGYTLVVSAAGMASAIDQSVRGHCRAGDAVDRDRRAADQRCPGQPLPGYRLG